MAKANGGSKTTGRKTMKPTAKTEQPNPGVTVAQSTGANGDSGKTTTMPSRPRPSAEELREAIRQRAYELYCQRGQQGGNPEDDWQQAEREILGRFGKTA